MKRSTAGFTAISLLLLLAACGQSGPLYLPGNPSKIQPPPEAPAESEEEDEKEEDDGSSRT